VRAQIATCPDCEARHGLTVLGPFDIRVMLLLPHHCRSARGTHNAIVGKAEEFLESIVKATEEDPRLYRVTMLAKQARFALEAKMPHGR
jgi:hypothetical protein